MVQQATAEKGFKLNYKRTFIIGFAFFGILLLWQVYDSWCTPFLTELFKNKLGIADEKKVQYLVGIMMAIDNLAALILLPIFGSLSDKTHTRIGRRMPYILLGTFVCCVAFPFIPVFFHHSNLGGVIALMAIVVLFAMMYRNPAVALMPDMTPKPLRSRANGIINIMGYIGGAFATVMGIFFDVKKKYLLLEAAQRSIWIVEIPFLIGSVLMLVSAIVLFILIKENKIRDEMADEMARGDALSETTDKVDDDKPLTRGNKIMLFCILGAEFFWFMADNAVGTFINNYVIYNTTSGQATTSILTIIGGVGSVIGFALGGLIASKIGRKYTVIGGLGLTLLAYLVWVILTFSLGFGGSGKVPVWMFPLFAIKGFGMSLVHINSFPMVVELCNSKKIGKFTGFYYASSMTAQTITPVAFGSLLLVPTFNWDLLPIYASICIGASVAIFIFVKNVRSTKTGFKGGLEGVGQDED